MGAALRLRYLPAVASPTRSSFAQGVLSLAGDGDAATAPIRIADFRRFLLVYTAGRSWLWVPLEPDVQVALVAGAIVASLAAAFGARDRFAVPAVWAALLVVLAQVIWRFPGTANHLYLEFICLAVLAVCRRDSRGADEAAALSALRLVTATVLFHTGLQKVLYGTWFQGDFLAFMVGIDDRFGSAFAWLLPADELARLASYDRKITGAGPYRVTGSTAPIFLLASNVVWIAEMILPVLLLVARTRWVAAVAGLALIVGIQANAREVAFGLLFVNLLLLFLPGRPNAWLLPAVAVVFAWALLAAAGLLPGDPVAWNLL